MLQKQYITKRKKGSLKIGKNRKFMKYLEGSMLQEKNSPYVALEKAKQEHFFVNISLKTLYNYIHQNLFVEFTEEEMVYKKKRNKNKIDFQLFLCYNVLQKER